MIKDEGGKSVEKTAKPKQAKPVAAAPQNKAPTEATIYVGPALQGGRLARYTIFKDGKLPANIAEIANSNKAVKRLIVPVSKLAQYEARLKDKTSAEAALFAEAGKAFSKGGE